MTSNKQNVENNVAKLESNSMIRFTRGSSNNQMFSNNNHDTYSSPEILNSVITS